ncbi:UNKNOWN [Stylonychia lemnae]|uniref:Transmembrane protein n=1 Tax=Stylonychia lemnae TaxID=5949 RepID=A0A077ZZ64_STYLE|nr:UNKNOWN [Stylonychia lemnae]|eukprot:CDW74867.1 UNKNOWN [Stylonychia lemnae]
MFHLILGILIGLTLTLTLSTLLIACIFEDKPESVSIIVKTSLMIQIVIQTFCALVYLYFFCIISKFVKEFLPDGLIRDYSLKSTKILFITFFIGIIIRAFVLWTIVFDVISQLDKIFTGDQREVIEQIASGLLNFTEIVIIFCFITILRDAKKSQLVIQIEKEEQQRRKTNINASTSLKHKSHNSSRISVLSQNLISNQNSQIALYDHRLQSPVASNDGINQFPEEKYMNEDFEKQLEVSSVNLSLAQYETSEFGDSVIDSNQREYILKETAFKLLDE